VDGKLPTICILSVIIWQKNIRWAESEELSNSLFRFETGLYIGILARFVKGIGFVSEVGSMKYRCIFEIIAHFLDRPPRSAAPANARLICAAGLFVGRAEHISLAP
jgi:hypothetical protein